ncbi:AMIN domain-containing protein [Candidatus Sulfurimonas marisnigri]|uniref:AMIN domain-containing protein n=1 Tax=Candidatus Sulfurimonas marisnigri TaxID=2740405 RepID=A0A7S7LZZ4_9BACT|nr:AMIN domain-containing protein [Candidatus Sulfurimonas marisnigri]QOY54580.1 AMIN domain-containing protein [Candidatus Sulfurimonas marisnigri]
MIKVLFISIFLLITLYARENPFFPSNGEKDIPFTSNENIDKDPLKRATITLPAQARILQKVTIEYKNLDGSLETKSIELDNSVDWHLPIFVSQDYGSSPTSEPIVMSKKESVKKSIEYKQIASTAYLKFYSSGKNLKIITSDSMIRNFLLVDPHRVVLDFKRDSSMKSYMKSNPKNIFNKIRIGNHDGYYRAVIELDGLYRYKLDKTSDGYMLKLI